ncbi:Bud-site selection protein [Coniella lustricola]|uniref:Bud-site selection protein n=1 Tax=Coniella lustricola TaxID=2025994 RepID=A0A2T3AMA4_9PEZI|nr:Bud-site selection protein [Coniella lustricola]
MPKRKRAEDELDERLSRHQAELARMLKLAKGFERQRMAKRLRDPKSTPEKKVRIENEIAVLKSLDLQSVATAHLCASLLKIKALAESPKLPEKVKNGVPKPEISEEERVALHNVTSGLYNQPKVRETLDKAVIDICMAMRVPMPDKNKKRKRGDKKNDAKDGIDENEPKSTKQAKQDKPTQSGDDSPSLQGAKAGSGEDESEWNGFSEDDEVEGGGGGEGEDEDESEDEEVDEKEQKALARFNDRLGGSDDERYDTGNEELDPMEITDISESEDSDGGDDDDESASEEDESISEVSEDSDDNEDDDDESGSGSGSDSDSSELLPPPKARKVAKTGPMGSSTTLPSLMGGYISGSESEASDIDVAPAARKNRRGQRARQAIWEKKFKAKAKHLEKEQTGRDSGWDLKRGAVEGGSKTPWKQGIKNPFGRRSAAKDEDNANLVPLEPRKPKPPKKDNDGPLHPSWEARKKAKEQQATASFQGKRVVFD